MRLTRRGKGYKCQRWSTTSPSLNRRPVSVSDHGPPACSPQPAARRPLNMSPMPQRMQPARLAHPLQLRAFPEGNSRWSCPSRRSYRSPPSLYCTHHLQLVAGLLQTLLPRASAICTYSESSPSRLFLNRRPACLFNRTAHGADRTCIALPRSSPSACPAMQSTLAGKIPNLQRDQLPKPDTDHSTEKIDSTKILPQAGSNLLT